MGSSREAAMVIVVMGVSGAGKTTVGRLLAQRLGADYVEGDSFHPPANIAKMSRGVPLDDADRLPWLEAISETIGKSRAEGRDLVIGCSALKERYRSILARGRRDLVFVHLTGPKTLIAERLARRDGHFMPAALLESQFRALEEPRAAITVDIHAAPEEIVELIRVRLAEAIEPETD
jgi:gluconokinase